MLFLRRINQATASRQRIVFGLYDYENPKDLKVGLSFAAGDVKLFHLDGTETTENSDNLPNELGTNTGIYEIQLSSAEFLAYDQGVGIKIVDQSATKLWMDQVEIVEFYGYDDSDLSRSLHRFDLDARTPEVNLTRIDGIDGSNFLAGAKTAFKADVTDAVLTPTTTTFRFTNKSGGGAIVSDDAIKDREVRFITGNLSGRVALIESYDHSNLEITMSAVEQAPADGDTFVVL